MKNKIKLYLLLAFVLVCAIVISSVGSFAGEFNESDIENRIDSVYSAIREKRGYSYEGYCGTFLIDQLNALQVGLVTNGGSLNGNRWYTTLVEGGVTVYGYTQTKYAGNDCVRDIIAANESEVYNVVVSFSCQYGYTEDNPGAGHAVLIYAINEGYVYFTENFEFSGIPEGAMIKLSVDEFYERFNKDYGTAVGAIHFEKKESTPEQELIKELGGIYEILNSGTGYDYSVDSGQYVLDQINAMGIGYRLYSTNILGGKIYSSLEKWGITQGGYVQKKYSGNDCLYDMVDAYPGELRNIAVSFKRELGATDSDPGAGHGVFIYAIKDGKVYFTENREFSGIEAGKPIQLTLSAFYERYNADYGNAVGAVHFTPIDTKGYYTVKNSGSNRYLNVYDDRDVDNTKVTIFEEDFTTGQYFRFEFDSKGFNLYSICAPTRALGIVEGSAVISQNAPNKTWYIEKISSGYLFRLSSDPTKVLMASGKYNSSGVVVADYEEGNKYQIWKINCENAEEMIKRYKITFDMDGRISEAIYSYGQLPTEPRATDFVTRKGIQYFRSWDSELEAVSGDKKYTALYDYVYVDFEITWDIGGSKITQTYAYGDIPAYDTEGIVAYDKTPVAVTDDAEYKVYFGKQDENGIKYYYGGKMLTGWNMMDGVERYFSKTTGYVLTGKVNIGGVEHYFNEDGSKYTGFLEDSSGTRYYKDSVMMNYFVEVEGKVYYFIPESGYMVKEETYLIGGVLWEFNEDHTVKIFEGWKDKDDGRYYFVSGQAVTGFYEIDGYTYYFSEDIVNLGAMLKGWQEIGGKNRYFGDDGIMATGEQTIDGKTYTFGENGELENGFLTVEGKTYYYENGKKAYGWRLIDGEYYYFFLKGSMQGDGVMCTEERVIGDVVYEFSEEGVCLNKFQ